MNRPGLVSILLLVAVPAPAQPDLQNLLANSPFGQARGPGGQETANATWEFRGVAEEAGEVWFSLYDTSAKRSVWVKRDATPPGLTLGNFDAAALTLTLDYQGKILVLPIKRAPQVAVASPLPGVIPGGPQPAVGGMAGPQPIQLNPGSSPADAQRIQQVTEEIRRRRALRQQAVQQGAPPAPSGNP